VRHAGTTRLSQRACDVETFDVAPDGEFYAISSNTSAAFRLTGDALPATFKSLTGQSDAAHASLGGPKGDKLNRP
jgi:hypothetical protein